MTDEDALGVLLLALLGVIAILLAVISSTLLFGAHITLIVFGAVGAVIVLIAACCLFKPVNVLACVVWVIGAAFLVAVKTHYVDFPWQIH